MPGPGPGGVLDVFSSLITGFLDHLLSDIRDSVSGLVETYLLSTHDVTSLTPRPLTDDPALQGVYHLTLGMADLLLVLFLTYAFLRTQWERGIRARYGLKTMLPSAMAAIALAHFALVFGQMAIDLNNALVHAVWTARLPGVDGPVFPWTFALTQTFGLPLFQLAVRGAIVVMMLILGLSYVMRFALLTILLAVAPLAALCLVLPETKSFARGWNRLFMVTVFMQFGQVLVLRLASAFTTELNGNPIAALYGAAVLYLVIKVPGVLSSSAHLEGRVQHYAVTAAKHAYKAATRVPKAVG
ncbi:MAG TPA: conjugal transfer protein TrbL family protein [Candidatus Limnocylindrales bacterium]|nr:conjugal transfer protein TrbL family protein [Candidatus Limnocylindrales bacterium]